MFDLESEILGWRRKMLSAGIKFPVPLEELETHLRERINHLKAGLSEAEAFQTAVKELGDGKILRREFSKGRFLWRVRTNPLALNIIGAWFILGGLNSFIELVNVAGLIMILGSLQFFVGIGLLYRGRFWRYCALAFCGLGTISSVRVIVSSLTAAPSWDLAGHYFSLMGILVPMKYFLAIYFLNFSLLVWATYVLAISSVKRSFRPAGAN